MKVILMPREEIERSQKEKNIEKLVMVARSRLGSLSEQNNKLISNGLDDAFMLGLFQMATLPDNVENAQRGSQTMENSKAAHKHPPHPLRCE